MRTTTTLLQVGMICIALSKVSAQKQHNILIEENPVTITLKNGKILEGKMELEWEVAKAKVAEDTTITFFDKSQGKMVNAKLEFRPLEKTFSNSFHFNGKRVRVKDIKTMEVVMRNRTHKYRVWDTPETIFSPKTLVWCSSVGKLEVYCIEYFLDQSAVGFSGKKSLDKKYFVYRNKAEGDISYNITRKNYEAELKDAFEEMPIFAENFLHDKEVFERLDEFASKYNYMAMHLDSLATLLTEGLDINGEANIRK